MARQGDKEKTFYVYVCRKKQGWKEALQKTAEVMVELNGK